MKTRSSFSTIASICTKALSLLSFVGALQCANAQSQATLSLFPNGDFSEADGASWDDTQFAGNQTFNWPSTGGNPGGYAEIVSGEANNWAVLISNNNQPYALAELGIQAGQTYTFQYDMKNSVAGDNKGGIKVESWSANSEIHSSGDQRVTVATADTWATYTYEYTIADNATHIKMVPLWSPNETVGFDNIGVLRIVQANWTVTASASIGGSITPSGEVSVANGGSQVFSFTADTDYAFADVLVNGSSVGQDNPYTLSNVIGSTTIQARFSYTAGIPNSGFEKADDSEWAESKSGDNADFTYTYPETGGSGSDHYVVIEDSAGIGQGFLTANNGQIIELSSLSLSAGNVYNFTLDMKVSDADLDLYGGLKVEFFNGSTANGASSVLRPTDESSDTWQTFKIPVYLPHDTDGIKLLLVSGDDSIVHYDNVGVETTSLASYAKSELPDPGFDHGSAAYEQGGAPNTFHYFEPSGGHPGAYALMENIGGGYGLLVTNNGAINKLSDLGLNTDETYQFTMDMILEDGTNIGGMKVDFFSGSNFVSGSGDIFPDAINGGTNWETYSFAIKIPAGVDGLKVVPLWGADSTVGYDNIAFSTQPYVVPAVVHTWTGSGGSSDYATVGNWDTNQVPNLSASTANASAMIGNANVIYTAGSDFQLRNGNVLQLNTGGSWKQEGSGSWFQMGGGIIRLNGGAFDRGTAGELAGRENNGTLEVTALGGALISNMHPLKMDFATVTLNGPLHLEALSKEIVMAGKIIALPAGSSVDTDLVSFSGGDSQLTLNGSRVRLNGGGVNLGIWDAAGGRGFNFPDGSTSEIVWTHADATVDKVKQHASGARILKNGAVADISAFAVTQRGNDIVLSLANVAKTITASTGSGGSISPSGDTTVAYDANQAYTITPDSGYAIADVLVDGVSIGRENSYTFSNVVQRHSIEAVFADASATYTISASAGTGGSISSAGLTEVSLFGSQSYTITPDEGYFIANVLVDGASVGAISSYSFSDVAEDHTIAASFAQKVDLLLDFQGGYSIPDGWIHLIYQGAQDSGNVAYNKVGNTAYNYSMNNIGQWDTGWFNAKINDARQPSPFTLSGLQAGLEVTLYAAAGWDGNAAGAYIVFGDSGASGVQAQTVGNPDPAANPTLANFTEIGTATVGANGEVSGILHGRNADLSGEGQTNGFWFVIQPGSTTGYADWIADYSGVGSNNGFANDADGDGKSNGLEYALGTNPSVADAADLVAGALSTASGNTFTFTHPQSSTLGSDVTLAYTWSTDLSSFHADGATNGGITVSFSAQNNGGTVTVTATLTGGDVPEKLFVRLGVSQ